MRPTRFDFGFLALFDTRSIYGHDDDDVHLSPLHTRAHIIDIGILSPPQQSFFSLLQVALSYSAFLLLLSGSG